ncbi:MAG: VWA domain-containing protein [Acidobacteria bacterium]|nr:MAG: VWA domain-containing protein [Acidobacteriota bacterium]
MHLASGHAAIVGISWYYVPLELRFQRDCRCADIEVEEVHAHRAKEGSMQLGNQLSLRVNRAFALLLVVLVISVPPVSSQSAIDEVHIQPRMMLPATNGTSTNGAMDPIAVSESGPKPMKVNVNLVLVPVTIMDGMNRLVQGLDRNSFQVLEGKTEQQIRYFSSEDAPVSMGIILDISGSMKSKLDRAREAVVRFINDANPDDEFFMVTFSDKPELVSDFTQNVEDIQGKLLYAAPKGRTALLDAIYMGIAKMRQAKHQRKALLIISDGGDNHSRYTEREIVSLVKEADVMIYGIGIYNHYFPTQEEMLGPELLRSISEVTGGTSFSIDDPNDLVDAAKSVGIMLRNQYLLGYRPAATKKDGKWHKIKIIFRRPKKLKLPGTFHVYARSGYYAAAE